MLQTIVLFLFNIASIYFTLDNLKKNTSRRALMNVKSFLTTLYIVGVAMPLLEESLFRSVCKQYLAGTPYSDYINGLIFGLVHIHNYFLHKNMYITIFQTISTAYLGYYLVQFESFLYAYLIHCLYNISISTFGYMIIYFVNKEEWDVTAIPMIFCHPTTQDDMLKPKSHSDYKFIKRNKIPADMLVRIDKFNEIQIKRISIVNLSK